MSSPKIISKCGYIKSTPHVLNILSYAGDKLASQSVMFKDGTAIQYDAEAVVKLSEAEQHDVVGIHLEYKDGDFKNITYEAYKKLTEFGVTAGALSTIQDDGLLLTNSDGKSFRRMQDLDFFKYLSYIEDRPGVEKTDGHGLFGLTGDISIENAEKMALMHEKSIKWSHIISLDADGAKRVGYDNREAWKTLIIHKSAAIAEAYKIPLEHLVINCAYHGNTDNPHVHLLFYSKDSRYGFINGGEKAMEKASRDVKSALFNEIFKGDTLPIKIEKSKTKDLLKKQIRQHVAKICAKDYSYTEINEKFHELSDHLRALEKGKQQYAFLSPDLKDKVDSLFNDIITRDKDMNDLFEKYKDIHIEFVRQYNVSEVAIEREMSEFVQRFFSPRSKKDNRNREYHNAIIKAAASLGKASPAAERATKMKTADSAISSAPVSTDTYDYFPFDREAQEYSQLVDEIPLPSDADAPPDIGGGLPEPPEHIPAATAPRERAAKGEKANFTTSKSGLSNKTVYEYLRNRPDCLNNKSFSKIYRQAFAGMYNPKIEKSELQAYLAAGLENLSNIEEKLRRKAPANQHAKNIFNALYNESPVFKESINSLFENSHTVLSAVVGEENAQKHLDKFKSDMLSPAITNAAHSYIFYFADTLQDQKYYQLMSAYSEFNKPLNKALYKGLSKMYDSQDSRPQFLKQLRELQRLSEYLDDEDKNAQACGMVRGLFSSLINDADVSPVFEEYESNYLAVITEHLEDSPKYSKQFSNNLRSVRRLMRPHYSIILFAKNYEQFVFDKVSRDKDAHKDLNSKLYSYLREALTDKDTFSSELIRQELERFDVSHKDNHLSSIFRYLYSTDDTFRQEADKTIETAYTRLKRELGTDSALSLIERYKENLFECRDGASHSWLMKHFVNNLIENYYRQITLKHKENFEPFNKALFKTLQNNITNKELMPKLAELQVTMNQDPPEAAEAVTTLEKRAMELSAEIFKGLRNKEITGLIDQCFKDLKPLFSFYCDDPNMQLALEERLYSDLYHGEHGTIQFIVQSFSKSLSLHQTKYVLKEMKPEISEFRAKLFSQLRKAFIRGNSQASSCLQLIKEEPRNASAFSLLLQSLSDGKTDFNVETEKLYQSFAEKMAQNDFNYSPRQTRELFDSFFYGQNESKYDTMFLKETSLNAYEQKDKIIAGFAVNTLFQSLACMMRDQSETAMQNIGNRGEKHMRKKPLLFKRLTPEHEHQPDINISY